MVVREPQYTTAVGLIQYAYKNARLQGRNVSAAPAHFEHVEKKSAKKPQPKQKKLKKQPEEKFRQE